MSHYEMKAEEYRERAEELRVIAEGMKDTYAREALLRSADDYERMAGWAEKIDLSYRSGMIDSEAH